MSEQFEEAVEWVARVSRPWVKDGQLDVGELDPMEAVFCLRLGVYWLPEDEGGHASKKAGRYVCHEGAAAYLMEIRGHSRSAHNLLTNISVDYLMRGEKLSPSLRTFAALQLAGRLEEPPKIKAYETAFANIYMYTLAKTVERDFGLHLTRGEAAKKHESACDAVAQGFAKNGHHRTAGSIIEICKGTTHKRVRSVSKLWVEAHETARRAGIIPARLLDRYWHGV